VIVTLNFSNRLIFKMGVQCFLGGRNQNLNSSDQQPKCCVSSRRQKQFSNVQTLSRRRVFRRGEKWNYEYYLHK